MCDCVCVCVCGMLGGLLASDGISTWGASRIMIHDRISSVGFLGYVCVYECGQRDVVSDRSTKEVCRRGRVTEPQR